jgi:hypothetical protein
LLPFNMLCIKFILSVTCLVNKQLQYNTYLPGQFEHDLID